ncbi:unnamed protein product, partial [Amoebophrya sp. A25]|eukprot:GSA25T00021213001.1
MELRRISHYSTRLNWSTALNLANEATQHVRKLHELGYAHGDIKPENFGVNGSKRIAGSDG